MKAFNATQLGNITIASISTVAFPRPIIQRSKSKRELMSNISNIADHARIKICQSYAGDMVEVILVHGWQEAVWSPRALVNGERDEISGE